MCGCWGQHGDVRYRAKASLRRQHLSSERNSGWPDLWRVGGRALQVPEGQMEDLG